MNTMEKQARDKKERLRHLLLFFACTRHHRDEKYGGPPKGAEKSDGIPPLFFFRRKNNTQKRISFCSKNLGSQGKNYRNIGSIAKERNLPCKNSRIFSCLRKAQCGRFQIFRKLIFLELNGKRLDGDFFFFCLTEFFTIRFE